MKTFKSNSPEETEAIGREIAKKFPYDATVCFFGDLGTGKTTLIKGLVSELTGLETHEVTSPTFTYLNTYKGRCTLHHFDLYRLRDVKDFLQQGFDEYLDLETLCLIEWAEKIESILKEPYVEIKITHLDECRRQIQVNM